MPIKMPNYQNLTFQNDSAPPLDAVNVQAFNDMAAPLSGQTLALASKVKTTMLPASGWSGSTTFQQAVTVPGVTASNTILVSPVPGDFEDYTENQVHCTAQGDNSLTFSAAYQPAGNITVNLVILDTVAASGLFE